MTHEKFATIVDVEMETQGISITFMEKPRQAYQGLGRQGKTVSASQQMPNLLMLSLGLRDLCWPRLIMRKSWTVLS